MLKNLFRGHRSPKPVRRRLCRPSVEGLECRLALATFLVTNTLDNGLGSLRQAILSANSNPGADMIAFNIPGAGPHTFQPASALPPLTDPVLLDGRTQPGYAGSPLLELNGSSAGQGASGLRLQGDNSTVRGLVINRFWLAGIEITGSNNVVEGNYLGTNLAGTAAQANGFFGVSINSGANNRIGGTAPGARNVISGNTSAGVRIDGFLFGTNSTLIQGNYIGTNAAGTAAVGNFHGVTISSSTGNTVGGVTPEARNVISGNQFSGIDFSFSAKQNLVQGNYVGTNAAGTAAVGNGSGVFFNGSEAAENTVGGTVAGAGNTIAFNGGVGVSVQALSSTATGNVIRGNALFSNTGLGIDLGNDGAVTPNDPGDADTGPNNLQNFPVLTAVTIAGGSTTVSGSLNSLPNATFTLEFFANSTCDPSGNGEGQVFLGTATVTSNGGGDANFLVTFPTAVPAGHFLTATATDAGGNTSEFARCQEVGPGPLTVTDVVDVVDVTPDPRNTPVASVDVVFSRPINPATFTFDDVTLTRDGVPVALTNTVTISFVSGNTYRINGLTSFTGDEGGYLLTVNAAGIQDQSGNPGQGSGSDAWVTDTTPPTVTDVVDMTPDPRSTPVATVEVLFSEAINLATFTFQDLTLTRDGSPVALSSAVTTSFVSGTTYRVSGLSGFTAEVGTYVLTVSASGVTDLAGNVGTGTASDVWMLTPPTTGEVRGTVWNDLNANGIRDAGEPGLAGWAVYLDQNNNGVPNAGEPSTPSDALGDYAFTDLAPGAYNVREVLPAGWVPTLPSAGSYTVTVTAGASAGGLDFGNFQPPPPPPGGVFGGRFPSLLATGTDLGALPHVRAFDPVTGQERLSFYAYDGGYRGGVAVAVGDVNGDHFPDVITAAGVSGRGHVKAFDGRTGEQVRSFFAFEGGFGGTVSLAAGDVNGDGFVDLVVGVLTGGGPHVKAFSGRDGALLMSFYAFDPGFRGGVRVASGDMDGDGRADVIAGVASKGPPHVRVFRGADAALLSSFYAYDPGYLGGVQVATGALGGRPPIVTGSDGPETHVKAFTASGRLTRSFLLGAGGTLVSADGQPSLGSVRLAAVDVNGDGEAELVAGVRAGGASLVQVFGGLNGDLRYRLWPYGEEYQAGLSVGAGRG